LGEGGGEGRGVGDAGALSDFYRSEERKGRWRGGGGAGAMAGDH
jgi:hypothetical protein